MHIYYITYIGTIRLHTLITIYDARMNYKCRCHCRIWYFISITEKQASDHGNKIPGKLGYHGNLRSSNTVGRKQHDLIKFISARYNIKLRYSWIFLLKGIYLYSIDDPSNSIRAHCNESTFQMWPFSAKNNKCLYIRIKLMYVYIHVVWWAAYGCNHKILSLKLMKLQPWLLNIQVP